MQFSQGQRELAIRALNEAEDRTARYYCIPPHRWQAMPYDLLTRQDKEWGPLPDAALAGVQLMQRRTPCRGDFRAFYRIQLNDPTILSAARRDNLAPHLYPFLVYIITHEMVHLVRLSTILDDPSVLPPFDADEEWRVLRISNQILVGSSEFIPVLNQFSGSR